MGKENRWHLWEFNYYIHYTYLYSSFAAAGSVIGRVQCCIMKGVLEHRFRYVIVATSNMTNLLYWIYTDIVPHTTIECRYTI